MEEIYGSDEANQHLSKFLDYMLPTQLAWDDPTKRRKRYSSQEQYHRVFWDKEDEEKEEEIHRRIRRALVFLSFRALEDFLVQFWKAETIRGRVYLTTSHQPFALHNLTTLPLTRYRKYCLGCKVAFSGDSEDDDDANGDLQSTITEGPIGRSFLNQLLEASPNVELYSEKEFPLRQVALDCGIKQIVALPVFRLEDGLCVGVLELLLTKERSIALDECIDDLNYALSWEEMFTIDPCSEVFYDEFIAMLKDDDDDDDAMEEITKALRQVCNTHHLPFACSWRRYKLKGHHVRQTPRKLLISDLRMSFGEGDSSFDHCRSVHYYLPWNDGKGLIGKAFLSDKPCICRDVTQLSIIEYPMAHFVHKSGLKGWFAICLKTIDTGNCDYVLEFYFSRGRTFMGDVQGLLSSVLAILKRELTTFEAITGDPAENDSFTEIDKSSFDDNSESFETVPVLTNDLIESRALHTDHGEVLQSTLYDPQCAKEDSINNGTDHIVGLIQSETTITHVEKQCATKGGVDNELKKNSPSYQEFSQHFGKTLNDLTEIYQVSRSTIKRWCREVGINRWPNSKRRKKSSLPNEIPDQMGFIRVTGRNVELTDQGTSSGTHPPCSMPRTNLSQTQSTSTLINDPYTRPGPPPTNSAPTAQGTSMVTVKVKYMDLTIKFDLSSSSRLADLVERVASRLKLQDGTSISFKYVDDDGDKISIMTDEDLWYCMKFFNYSTIRLSIDI